MLTRFYYKGELLIQINSTDGYKVGEFIDIEEHQKDVQYMGTVIPKFKTYVIKRIVRAIELQKLTGGTLTQLPNFRTPEISLNVYLSSEREYKLKLIE